MNARDRRKHRRAYENGTELNYPPGIWWPPRSPDQREEIGLRLEGPSGFHGCDAENPAVVMQKLILANGTRPTDLDLEMFDQMRRWCNESVPETPEEDERLIAALPALAVLAFLAVLAWSMTWAAGSGGTP